MSIKRNRIEYLACLLLALLAGCATGSLGVQDFDGDGTQDGDDCEPSNASIYPGADDTYGDGVDQDCDGADGNAGDLDNDGTANEDDCAPEDADIYPGADDPYGDTIDQDCDGADGDANDLDNDGTANEGDCAPEDAAIYPGAEDTYGDGIDQDCDGLDGVDSDGDGYASTDSGGDDCNDGDAGIHPGADDPDDAIDQDCDGFARQTTVDLRPDSPMTSDVLYIQVDSDSAVLGIAWFLDGVERSEYAGFEEIPYSQTSREQTWRVEVTPYSASAEAGTAASDSVVIGNSAPSAATLIQGLVPDPREGDVLTAIASASDDDLDTVTMLYGWFVNGVQVSPSPGEQLDSTHFDKGDSIYVVLTPSDGIDEGTPVTSNTVTAVNTPPLAVSAAIDPTDGTEETTFSCLVSGWQDPDPADTEAYDFQWYVNEVVSVPTATLDGASFGRGDSLRCEATPNDGEATGSTLVSSVVTVGNTLPSISSVTIDPTAGDEGTIFICLPTGWLDPDPADATPDYSYQWYVGAAGSEVASVTTETIDGSSFDRDDSIYCEATPLNVVVASMPAEAGAPVASAALVIANTVPQITSASIEPTGATTADTLSVLPTGWTDDDGDTEGYLYQWSIEDPSGNIVPGGTAATLDFSTTLRGDSITVEVTPTDGTDSGSTVLAGPVVIANTLPSAPTVEVTPSQPTISDDLTCSITGASTDPDVDDGIDSLSYEISWFEGSTHQPSYDVSSADTSGTSVVPASATTESEVWTCEVIPSDSEGAGPVGEDAAAIPSGCSSLSFDGTNDKISVPHSNSLNLSGGSFTVESWVKRGSGTGTTDTIFSKRASTSSTGWSMLYHHGISSFRQNLTQSGYPNLDAPFSRTDSWVHVAATYEQSTGLRALWLNGNLADSSVVSFPTYSSSAELRLGWDGRSSDGYYFDGNLDELRISSEALYSGPFTPAASLDATSTTVALWKFNSGSGATAIDSSGNGHHGTITGATWSNSCPDEDSDGDGTVAWQDCNDGSNEISDCSFSVSLDGTVVASGTLDPSVFDPIPLGPWIHTDSTAPAQSADWLVDYLYVYDSCTATIPILAEDFDDLSSWSITAKGGIGSIHTSASSLVMTSDYNQITYDNPGANLGSDGYMVETRFYQGSRSAGLFVKARRPSGYDLNYQPKQIWGGKGAAWTEPFISVHGEATSLSSAVVQDGWHTLQLCVEP